MKGNKHLRRNRVCDLDKKRTFACILFFLFAIFLLTPAVTVADEVTIGTDYCLYDHLPVEPYYCFTYSQSIFLQGDINASGPIYIDSIKYHWNGAGSWTDDIQVYMGHTTYSSFSTWKPLSTMTEVYSGDYSVSASAGWYKIVLDEPFYYNNSDNLVIAVDEDTYTYHSSSQSFYTTSQGTNRSIYYYSDSYNPNPSSPPTGALSSYCPNIKIYYHHATMPPTVTTHPESQAIDDGEDVAFTVTATGTPELTYQWYKNGTYISGETSTTLSLNSVPSSDDGSTYFAVVSNSEGSDTSNAATLTVYGFGGGSSALCDVWQTNTDISKIWPMASVENVGIGMQPTGNYKLEVNGTANFRHDISTRGGLNIHGIVGSGPYTLDVNGQSHFSGNSHFDYQVGIGKVPSADISLDVSGVARIDKLGILCEPSEYIEFEVNGDAQFNAQTGFFGQVGIGITPVPGGGILQVSGDTKIDGELTAKEITVTLDGFPDYVFEKDYKLKSLPELEKFINENGHLPGIPKENEVKKEGMNVGDMQAKLLEKIEEMALHMINMQKRIDELESKQNERK